MKNRKNNVVRLIFILSFCLLTPLVSFADTAITPQIPVKGMVTMVDIGAKKCIPCKMMAPILDELKIEYKDRAAVIFIDVWENPSEGKKFGIKTIPTQIFYDDKGDEVQRHVGFLDKESIVSIFKKLGVK